MMPEPIIGSTILLRSTRAPSAWLPFQLLCSCETARRRVPPSSTSSYSARVHAVDGSSACSAAFCSFSSAACSACSSEDCWLQARSEEHTSELQSRGHLVCRLLLEKKKNSSRQSERYQRPQ